MNAWVITLTHLDLHILEASMEAVYKTRTARWTHVLVDHHWPIGYWNHRRAVLKLAERYEAKVIAPFENLGAHGGASWAIRNLPAAEFDLILTVDGDSFPVTNGWDTAMIEAMRDPAYGALSLLFDFELYTKDWEFDSANGYKTQRPARGSEMFNMTAWRYSVLRDIGGIKAHYNFYGMVEGPMVVELKKRGLKHGFLSDFKETKRPIEPDQRYTDWKYDHLHGYLGNFDEWLKEKSCEIY